MNRSSQNLKSDGEQLFSCGYRKSSTMTDPYPTGPVVYILRNGKSLYVGATIDLSHRIRQHNGELSGGAHRTSTKGPGWVCLLYVQGFQSRTESLQFEYACVVPPAPPAAAPACISRTASRAASSRRAGAGGAPASAAGAGLQLRYLRPWRHFPRRPVTMEMAVMAQTTEAGVRDFTSYPVGPP